jgi:hypothetical protein
MMTNLKFETGKTTCAWKHGNFCEFMGSKSYGTQPFCTVRSASGPNSMASCSVGDRTQNIMPNNLR